MISVEPEQAACLAVASFFTGMSKGGMPALGMIAVPLVSLTMPPLQAAALMLPILIATDFVAVWFYRRAFDGRNLAILMPSALAGIALAWAAASVLPDSIIALTVGVLGLLFCLRAWTRSARFVPPQTARIAPGLTWGVLAGVSSFVFNAGAPAFQIYVAPQKLPKLTYAGTATILFTFVNVSKLVPYASLNLLSREALWWTVCLLVPGIVGVVAGRMATTRLPERGFYILLEIMLFIVSLKLVVGSSSAINHE